MQAAWLSQESFPVWQDLKYSLFFACAYPVLQSFLYKTVLEKAARSTIYAGRTPVNKLAQEKKELGVKKYKESAWKLLFYALAWSYGVYITYDKEWWITGDTQKFWSSWPGKLRMDLKLFYSCELGFYLYGIVFLLIWETRRKDFGVMAIHHVGTIILICYSYFSGFFRVGNMVLLAHDISDILLEGAKLFKYSSNEAGASITFALFAISWLVFRLFYYPLYLIRSTAFEAPFALIRAGRTVWQTAVYYYCFNTFLIMLLVLHVYWFYLIARMIVKQVQNSGAVGDDVRSDSDDD